MTAKFILSEKGEKSLATSKIMFMKSIKIVKRKEKHIGVVKSLRWISDKSSHSMGNNGSHNSNRVIIIIIIVYFFYFHIENYVQTQ